MTKEETLKDLYKAKDIIYQFDGCRKRIYNIKSQYQQNRPYPSTSMKYASKPFTIGIAIVVILLIFSVITIFVNQAQPLGVSILYGSPIVAAFVAILVALTKGRKKIIDRKIGETNKVNQAIGMKNERLKAEQDNVEKEMAVIQDRYNRELAGKYPPDYFYPEAVDYFIYSIENFKANNLQEAVNSFDEELHRRKIEMQNEQNIANQKAMQNQLADIEEGQRVGNALAMGQLATQWYTIYKLGI